MRSMVSGRSYRMRGVGFELVALVHLFDTSEKRGITDCNIKLRIVM